MKKFSNLDLKLPAFPLLKEDKEGLSKFFAKEGFFNFISFNFSKIFPNLFFGFSSEDEMVFSFSDTIDVCSWIWLSLVCDSAAAGVDKVSSLIGSAIEVLFSSEVTCCATFSKSLLWFFNLSLSSWTSSNHFSKIGIASSKLVVPDDEIFCFPSI